jgi:succinate dehydrogenase / fumarate reductase, cytochrome b subunit
VATRTRKSKDDYGRPYWGHEGQWSWLAHRISGVGIILFLFAHVIDTAVVGWGPEAYNRVVSVYENPLVRILEYALVAGVISHALNGLKIIAIDFFPSLATRIRPIGYATLAAFILAMIPVTWIMGSQIIDLLRSG